MFSGLSQVALPFCINYAVCGALFVVFYQPPVCSLIVDWQSCERPPVTAFSLLLTVHLPLLILDLRSEGPNYCIGIVLWANA